MVPDGAVLCRELRADPDCACAYVSGRLADEGFSGRGVPGWDLRIYLRAGSVEIMIVAADGTSLFKIEKQYDPRLMQLLMMLDDVLHEQGLGLFCTKCHRLGMPDGVRGMSTPEKYVLECGCARRTFRPTGKATVELQQ